MKASSLDESIQKLCSLSQQINEYADRLSAYLAQAESQLRQAGLGLRVWLDKSITATTPEGDELTFRLGWAKTGKGAKAWGFHWITEADLLKGEAPQPLADAQRWVRVAAFHYVDALVVKLITAAEETLQTFEPIKGELPKLTAIETSSNDTETEEEDIPF